MIKSYEDVVRDIKGRNDFYDNNVQEAIINKSLV